MVNTHPSTLINCVCTLIFLSRIRLSEPSPATITYNNDFPFASYRQYHSGEPCALFDRHVHCWIAPPLADNIPRINKFIRTWQNVYFLGYGTRKYTLTPGSKLALYCKHHSPERFPLKTAYPTVYMFTTKDFWLVAIYSYFWGRLTASDDHWLMTIYSYVRGLTDRWTHPFDSASYALICCIQ